MYPNPGGTTVKTGVPLVVFWWKSDRFGRLGLKSGPDCFLLSSSEMPGVERDREDEQGARIDLEILIHLPGGVVGLQREDGRAQGARKSLNRESRRLFEILRSTDQSLEDLLQALTFRRGDGWEFSLGEFPMTQALSVGGDGVPPRRTSPRSGIAWKGPSRALTTKPPKSAASSERAGYDLVVSAVGWRRLPQGLVRTVRILRQA